MAHRPHTQTHEHPKPVISRFPPLNGAPSGGSDAMARCPTSQATRGHHARRIWRSGSRARELNVDFLLRNTLPDNYLFFISYIRISKVCMGLHRPSDRVERVCACGPQCPPSPRSSLATVNPLPPPGCSLAPCARIREGAAAAPLDRPSSSAGAASSRLRRKLILGGGFVIVLCVPLASLRMGGGGLCYPRTSSSE